jgi:transposase-like protein
MTKPKKTIIPQRVIHKFEVTRTDVWSEQWELSDTHCPKCGKTDVRKKIDPALFLYGQSHLCLSCGARYSLTLRDSADRASKDDSQRLRHLRRRV